MAASRDKSPAGREAVAQLQAAMQSLQVFSGGLVGLAEKIDADLRSISPDLAASELHKINESVRSSANGFRSTVANVDKEIALLHGIVQSHYTVTTASVADIAQKVRKAMAAVAPQVQKLIDICKDRYFEVFNFFSGKLVTFEEDCPAAVQKEASLAEEANKQLNLVAQLKTEWNVHVEYLQNARISLVEVCDVLDQSRAIAGIFPEFPAIITRLAETLTKSTYYHRARTQVQCSLKALKGSFAVLGKECATRCIGLGNPFESLDAAIAQVEKAFGEAVSEEQCADLLKHGT